MLKENRNPASEKTVGVQKGGDYNKNYPRLAQDVHSFEQ